MAEKNKSIINNESEFNRYLEEGSKMMKGKLSNLKLIEQAIRLEYSEAVSDTLIKFLREEIR